MKGQALLGITAAGGATLALSALLATPANALVVSVGGERWDVTTITTTFNAARPLLESQTWWGDEGRASDFGNAVGSSLGFPNGLQSIGPLFAFESIQNFLNAFALYPPNSLFLTPARDDESLRYARATRITTPEPVPGPIPFLGAAAALCYSRKLRKKVKASRNRDANSAKIISSSTP